MKTSLGIWAFGSMATRFVPGGYKPEWAGQNTVARVRSAVEGLGDLIDGYEFHYPQELSADNLDEIRDALDGHDIYCVATGLHLDPLFGKGGLVSPDEGTRREAVARTLDAIDFAGELGAHFIIWPGIEGYNYPFQSPYRESWEWFLDGLGEAAQRARDKGVTIFLEHKNSEPAMKILMRSIGMTMHVIHKLRVQGLDNVKVNMDWQHLIMNGESLAEYAALLAAEGVLGHQHANDGWGSFDDDNMVGTIRFMETLELAVELRRAGYGDNGERLGFDLYPYTEDAVGAVKRSVLQWRFIDAVAARIDDAALREAQSRKDAVAAYEIVYAALGADHGVSEVAELARALVAIDSVNPDLIPGARGEAEVAGFVADWLERAGLDVSVEEAAPNRPNVVGVARGSGGGRTLLLNAHTDTVGSTRWSGRARHAWRRAACTDAGRTT